MRRAARHSFSLDRPGLRPGYRVGRRLRIVDTVTIALGVASGFASILLWVWLIGRIKQVIILNNAFAILAITFAGLTLVIYVVHMGIIWWMRLLLLLTGLLSKQEARSYPLRWGKQCVDAWPETWQEPGDPQRIGSQADKEGRPHLRGR